MKTILTFPNYSIDENGTIVNIKKNKIIQPFLNASYYKVNLFLTKNKKKSLYVHRLIAETFIPNPQNKKEVNHIDGNKLNNNINNLEWVSRKENAQHSYMYGLQKPIKGENNVLHKKVLQYDLNGNFVRRWDCVMDIERELGIKNGAISNCCLGKSKTSGNFIWKYL